MRLLIAAELHVGEDILTCRGAIRDIDIPAMALIAHMLPSKLPAYLRHNIIMLFNKLLTIE